MKYNPSVMGRLELYDKSMDELLTHDSLRVKKVTKTDVEIKFPLGVKNMYLTFPAGIPLNTIANFDVKLFIEHFTEAYLLREKSGDIAFKKYWMDKFADDPKRAEELTKATEQMLTSITTVSGAWKLATGIFNQKVDSIAVIAKHYKTCDVPGEIENMGHNFSTNLDISDKQALKAFMATF